MQCSSSWRASSFCPVASLSIPVFSSRSPSLGASFERLLIGGSCLRRSARFFEQHAFQFDGGRKLRMLLKQSLDGIHCRLPVAVLGQAEGLVHLLRHGRIGCWAHVLRASYDSSGDQKPLQTRIVGER